MNARSRISTCIITVSTHIYMIPHNIYKLLTNISLVTAQARCGDPRQGGAGSGGPIGHACIATLPAKHRYLINVCRKIRSVWQYLINVRQNYKNICWFPKNVRLYLKNVRWYLRNVRWYYKNVCWYCRYVCRYLRNV